MSFLPFVFLAFLSAGSAGDKTISATGPKVTVPFSSPGLKVITLKVCNAGGCSTTSRSLTVLDPRPSLPPFSFRTVVGSAEPWLLLDASPSGKPPLSQTWTLSGPSISATRTGSPARWTPTELGPHSLTYRVSNTYGLASGGPLAFSVVPSTFADVPPDSPRWPLVEALAANRITSGCADAPPLFCPDSPITRAQAAVQVSRVLDPAQALPAATGLFQDVPPGYWAAPQIEHLYRLGVTNGCSSSPRLFCPEGPLTRAQAAVFVLRAEHGPGYAPPPPLARFADVPLYSPYAAFIEQLAREGATSGCSLAPPLFCPETTATRLDFAVFLARALGLAHRPSPLTFQAAFCDSSCSFPAFLPIFFEQALTPGLPTAFDYDWNGDGVFEETSSRPVSFHTYTASGSYRPRFRVRSSSWTSPVRTHVPITVRSPIPSLAPISPTGLSSLFVAVVPPARADLPGTLWRNSYVLAAKANAVRAKGLIAYVSIGGAAFKPWAVLPTDLNARVYLPVLSPGAFANVYLVAFNESASSPPTLPVPLPIP